MSETNVVNLFGEKKVLGGEQVANNFEYLNDLAPGSSTEFAADTSAAGEVTPPVREVTPPPAKVLDYALTIADYLQGLRNAA